MAKNKKTPAERSAERRAARKELGAAEAALNEVSDAEIDQAVEAAMPGSQADTPADSTPLIDQLKERIEDDTTTDKPTESAEPGDTTDKPKIQAGSASVFVNDQTDTPADHVRVLVPYIESAEHKDQADFRLHIEIGLTGRHANAFRRLRQACIDAELTSQNGKPVVDANSCFRWLLEQLEDARIEKTNGGDGI